MNLTFVTLISVLALLFLLASIISKAKGISYRNEQYGFTIRLPSKWKGKYIIREDAWKWDGYRSVDFVAPYENGKRLYPVLSIVISDDKDKIKESKIARYLGEKEELYYGYICDVADPSDYLSDNPSMLKVISDMTKKDSQVIVQTFRFIG